MCARFIVDDDDFDINEIIEAAKKNLNFNKTEATQAVWQQSGRIEVFPGSYAPVIAADDNVRFMLWGFPNLMPGKQPLINARSETAAVKKTFSEAMEFRRCIIPASGFFEWKNVGKKKKEKYEFTLPEKKVIYMAGIYSSDNKFSILTRDASPSVAEIHDRMPVILPKALTGVWLNESADVIRDALTEVHSQHVTDGSSALAQMSMF